MNWYKLTFSVISIFATTALLTSCSGGGSSPTSFSQFGAITEPTVSYDLSDSTYGFIGVPMSIAPFTLRENGSPIVKCDIKNGTLALPTFLRVDPKTCVISGVPIAILPPTQFQIVAANSYGTSQAASVTIAVYAGLPVVDYSNATGKVGFVGAFMQITPSTLLANSAYFSGCKIKNGTPALPNGLSLDGSCAISGIPSSIFPETELSIVATNSVGLKTEAKLKIEIRVGNPALRYSQVSGTVGKELIIRPDQISLGGSSQSNCQLGSGSPFLPAGLYLNRADCVISGVPTVAIGWTSFKINLTTSVSSVEATLTLLIADLPPTNLTYDSVSPTYLVGNPISANKPSSKGGIITSYWGQVPDGLYLDYKTGIITGTPRSLVSRQDFTITASNNSGSVQVRLSIAVLAQVAILNVKNGQTFESVKVIGSSFPEISAVGCKFDNLEIQDAIGLNNWSCSFPAAAANWKFGSYHKLLVGEKNGTALSKTMEVYFFKGLNKDLNGDGYPDLVIGSQIADQGLGKVHIYYGASTGVSTTPSKTLTGSVSGAQFGSGIAEGDFNGDGFSDLAVGAYNKNIWRGVVYIFNGGPDGVSNSPSYSIEPDLGQAQFGGSLAAGNLESSAYDSLVVGAPGINSVFVYSGNSAGLGTTATKQLTVDKTYQFGISIAIANPAQTSFGDFFVGATRNYIASPASQYSGVFTCSVERNYCGSSRDSGPYVVVQHTNLGNQVVNYRPWAGGFFDVNGDGNLEELIPNDQFSVRTSLGESGPIFRSSDYGFGRSMGQ